MIKVDKRLSESVQSDEVGALSRREDGHIGVIESRRPYLVARLGLGRCRLCSCQAFRGRGNICEDCGHHYDEHTTSPF